jgi:hypothetical protein
MHLREMKPAPRLRAITAFHFRVGSRLAIRALVPFSALVVAAIGSDAEPGAALSRLASGVAGRAFDPGLAGMLLLSALAIASWASPRVTQGLTGWIRHLPADSRIHRRAAILGLAAAQIPILACVLLLGAGLALKEGAGSLSAGKLLGVPLLALGAATSVIPVRPRLMTAAAGSCAALLGAVGDPLGLAAGAALILVSDRLAGPLETPPSGRRARRGADPARLPLLLPLRALGWRIGDAYLAASLPLAAASLFLLNNRLDPTDARLAARLGGGLAASVCLASLAQTLAVRRPPWPWARALPWSSRRRIMTDALVIGSLAIPAAAFPALLAWPSGLAMAVAVPSLALRAAAAMRTSATSRTGVAGRVLFEASGATALIALLPWLALVTLALLPAAARAAGESERRMKVSRWSPAHHLAAGDPLSWSSN